MSIKPLKYRKPHETINLQDHNDHVDNWNNQVKINRLYIPYIEDLSRLVDELAKIVSKMTYRKYGEFVYASDHNLFVDAWNKQMEINNKMKYLAELLEKAILLEVYTRIEDVSKIVVSYSISYSYSVEVG